MRNIFWLDEIGIADVDQVGAKALGLAEARRAGLLVPDGFCLTVAVYRAFVVDNHLDAAVDALQSTPADDVEAEALRLQSRIRASHIGGQIRAAIIDSYRKLDKGVSGQALAVAVRSSATLEDLPGASFAGQQSTLLNVRTEEALLRAVLECWASLWSPRAVAYRRRQCGALIADMAVLVQVMVGAESAGVAFSRDPVTGEDRVVIEAAFGLGEAVVSGEGEIDRYLLSRDTCLETEPPVVAHKPQQRVMTGQAGLQTIAVPRDKQDRRVLTPEQSQGVAQAALTLERHFGCPQDIEWAFAGGRLHILQSRPVTTAPCGFFTDVLPGDDHIWTAGFLNERFPLPVSPLGWSVVSEVLERLAFRDPLRYLGLRGTERLRITRLYRAHPYVNLFVFQTLYKVFPDALLPEDAYRYFPDGRTELRYAVEYPHSILDPRFLFSMAWHFLRQPAVWSPWHNYRTWAGFTRRHDERMRGLEAELAALQGPSAALQDIWRVARQAQELTAELLSLHRWSLTCADLTYSLMRRLVRAWVRQEGATELCTRLVIGLPNRSMEVDSAVRTLARLEDASQYAPALRAFLERYGHRSFSLDIHQPTFADEPSQVTALVQSLRGQRQRTPADHAAAREQARQMVRQALGRGPLAWLRRAVFEHVLFLTQRYMPLREDQRFYWQKTLALQRWIFCLLGRRMDQAGVLRQDEDVFFLTQSEVKAWVNGASGAEQYATLAAARQTEFARLRREFDVAPERAYPPFLRGNEPLAGQAYEGETSFQGRAVSPGLATGRVVILRSPSEFNRVRAGDVLVASGVDPGWTPIFSLLSALVLEHGGQLSHAAVVAREYGLPAVAGIPGITHILREGDQVMVDGLSGAVVKLSPTADAGER